jgi:hypothetical protein
MRASMALPAEELATAASRLYRHTPAIGGPETSGG